MYGLIGQTVGDAVAKRREQLGLTYAQLSRKLAAIGQDIPTLGLRNIEDCQRRVDVDELVALAIVLGVSPVTLLMPPAECSDTRVDAPGPDKCIDSIEAGRFWQWLTAVYPLSGSVMSFYNDALPPWERAEIEGKLGAVRS